jgi:hypothetical protein
MRDNVRKNDERNPRHMRGSDDKGSQNQPWDCWQVYFDTLQCIAEIHDFKNYDVDNLNVIRNITEALHEKPDMTTISPVLPNRDELDKVSEVENRLKRYPHLERCYFASDSAIAGLREFYSEIASSRNQDLEAAFEQGVTALKVVINSLNTLKRIQTRVKKILVWLTDDFSSVDAGVAKLNSLSQKRRDKFCRIVTKINNLVVESYSSITKVVDTSWDYLPSELQEALKSLAQKIVLGIPQIEAIGNGITASDLSDTLSKTRNTYNALVISVFTGVENGRNKPKLQIMKLFEGWNFSLDVPEQKATASLAMAEIQELTFNLAQLSGVEQVNAVACSPGKLHRIVFHLNLSADVDEPSSFDDLDDLWELAQRIALRSNRRLRELTGEKWYFNVDLNESPSDYPNSNNVIAVAHAESKNPHSAS